MTKRRQYRYDLINSLCDTTTIVIMGLKHWAYDGEKKHRLKRVEGYTEDDVAKIKLHIKVGKRAALREITYLVDFNNRLTLYCEKLYNKANPKAENSFEEEYKWFLADGKVLEKWMQNCHLPMTIGLWALADRTTA